MTFGRLNFQEDAQFADSEMTFVDGYVNCNGASQAVSATTLGTWVTVAKASGTGRYSVTFNRAFHQIKSVAVVPVLPLTTDITWALDQTATDLTDTTGFVIQFKTAGSAANLPSDAGFLLSVVLKDLATPDGV